MSISIVTGLNISGALQFGIQLPVVLRLARRLRFRLDFDSARVQDVAKPLPLWIGIDPRWGIAGLTASAGVAGWVEFALLRRGLSRRLGAQPPMARFVAKLWMAAATAAIAGTAGRFLPLPDGPTFRAVAPLVRFGTAMRSRI